MDSLTSNELCTKLREGTGEYYRIDKLMEDAADEIERLNLVIEDLEQNAAARASSEPLVRHAVTCKLFPDPHDERDPVGPCTCGASPPPCVVCRKPLPPLAQWSMPACPSCTEAAERAVDINVDELLKLQPGRIEIVPAPPPSVCRERQPCDGLVEVAETDVHVVLQCPRCGGCVNVQKERIHALTKSEGLCWECGKPATHRESDTTASCDDHWMNRSTRER
jgi:uncharacterized C2H2 Zn-finger protein